MSTISELVAGAVVGAVHAGVAALSAISQLFAGAIIPGATGPLTYPATATGAMTLHGASGQMWAHSATGRLQP